MIKRCNPEVGNVSPEVYKALGLSQMVKAGGFLHFSGILSALQDGSCHAPGDMEGQVLHIVETLKKLLSSEGLALDSLVATTLFTTKMEDLGKCIPIFKREFGDHPPVSTWIGVDRVGPSADFLLEFVPIALA